MNIFHKSKSEYIRQKSRTKTLLFYSRDIVKKVQYDSIVFKINGINLYL